MPILKPPFANGRLGLSQADSVFACQPTAANSCGLLRNTGTAHFTISGTKIAEIPI